MDARKIIFDRLVGVAGLSEDNVFSSGSDALRQSPREKPFVILQMGTELAALGGSAQRQTALIYVHNDQGSMASVDALHSVIRSALEADPTTAEGGLVGIRYEDTGTDLADDFYKTIFRTATYTVAGKVE